MKLDLPAAQGDSIYSGEPVKMQHKDEEEQTVKLIDTQKTIQYHNVRPVTHRKIEMAVMR